jgi:methylase of polypeptide subunit release factors
MRSIRRARARIYDAVVVSMTADWYDAVLQRVRPRSHILDVGIGTGAALLVHAKRLCTAELRITGVDIDAAYVDSAAEP